MLELVSDLEAKVNLKAYIITRQQVLTALYCTLGSLDKLALQQAEHAVEHAELASFGRQGSQAQTDQTGNQSIQQSQWDLQQEATQGGLIVIIVPGREQTTYARARTHTHTHTYSHTYTGDRSLQHTHINDTRRRPNRQQAQRSMQRQPRSININIPANSQ
jgi:hypothetical protein